MPPRKPTDQSADEWRDTIDADPQPATPPATTEPPPTEEDAFLSRFQSVVSRHGIDSLKIKLDRRGRGSELEWCCDYLPQEWQDGDLSLIREQWGPGQYQLRVVARNGIAMREMITIAEQRAPIVQTQAPSEMRELLSGLMEGQRALLEAIAHRPDPTAQMQQTLGLMVTMREAMGLSAAPAATNPSAMLGDIVGAIRQLREVAEEVSPKAAPDSDNPLAMLPPVLDIVKAAMAQQQQSQVAPMMALPPSIAATDPRQMSLPEIPPTVAPMQQSQPEPDPEEDMQSVVLKIMMSRLVLLAHRNAPPEKAAALIEQYAPDELFDLIEAPNWFDLLTNLLPDLKPYPEWCGKVRDILMRDDDPTEGPGAEPKLAP